MARSIALRRLNNGNRLTESDFLAKSSHCSYANRALERLTGLEPPLRTLKQTGGAFYSKMMRLAGLIRQREMHSPTSHRRIPAN
jgi:hypothetical protein